MKIDAHQHFWRYNDREYGWISDRMAALRRDFLPEDLAREQGPLGFDGSVAVQARQSLAETEWLLELADEHPRLRGVVGWVDLCSPEVGAQLDRFADRPKLRGIRHVVQDEPDDRFLLRADFLRGVGLLGRRGLTYDILIYPRHLPAACELARRFPEQPFVLDHIAKPFIREGKIEPWAADIRALAAHPNVCCKLSGMVSEADWERWKPADFEPYLDVVVEAFGPRRLMIGSDWPVCTVAASYAEAMGMVTGYIGRLSQEDRSLVLGGNAASFYGIG